jgi:hypothetical protein
VRVVASLLLALGLGACTRVSGEQRFEPTSATVEVVRTMPEADGEATPDVAVRVCWSDLLDPRSLDDGDARMGSGPLITDARLEFELVPWTDLEGKPYGHDADAPWCAGSVVTVVPRESLTAGVRYRMYLADEAIGWKGQKPNVETDGWISNPEGTSLNFAVEFDVVPSSTPAGRPEEPEEAVTLEMLFEPGAVFDRERATCSCHRDPDDDATALLDLRTPEAAYDDLLINGRLRDTGYPRVTPRRPSESFLLHKVLRDDGERLPGIYGDAMPPGDTPLPYGDYVMLARWIADGALR